MLDAQDAAIADLSTQLHDARKANRKLTQQLEALASAQRERNELHRAWEIAKADKDAAQKSACNAILKISKLKAEIQRLTARLAQLEAGAESMRAALTVQAEIQLTTDAEVQKLTEATATLRAALEMILNEPHGCPMCDSGTLRNERKDHWETCGFAAARKALATARGETP